MSVISHLAVYLESILFLNSTRFYFWLNSEDRIVRTAKIEKVREDHETARVHRLCLSEQNDETNVEQVRRITLVPRKAGQLKILRFLENKIVKKGRIKDFTIFGKQNRQKRAHAPFFLALIFRYKTDIFQSKKKLHIDLKKKK